MHGLAYLMGQYVGHLRMAQEKLKSRPLNCLVEYLQSAPDGAE
jgi:hypothetical protein